MNKDPEEFEYDIGTVKCFFSLKGYGFITREKGKDLFFFYKDVILEEQILEGARVKFRVDKNVGGRGPKALEIERIG